MPTVKLYGNPAPKGSMKCVGPRACSKCGTPVIHTLVPDDSSGNGKEWRSRLEKAGTALLKASGGTTLDGPLQVEAVFVMPPPKVLRGRPWPHVRPDVDKLARMLLDALTSAAVMFDDARVVKLIVSKCYPCDRCMDRPGVRFEILPMPAPVSAIANPEPDLGS